MTMNKRQAAVILKAAEKVKLQISVEQQKAYFKPFYDAKKPWADAAVNCAATFALEIDSLLTKYRLAVEKLVANSNPFTDSAPVKRLRNIRRVNTSMIGLTMLS
jgi:hypothetical protein